MLKMQLHSSGCSVRLGIKSGFYSISSFYYKAIFFHSVNHLIPRLKSSLPKTYIKNRGGGRKKKEKKEVVRDSCTRPLQWMRKIQTNKMVSKDISTEAGRLISESEILQLCL